MTSEIKNRLYQIRSEIVDTCTICGGVGYLEEDQGIVNPCKCMTVFLYVMELVEAGIAQAYWHLSLDTLKISSEYIDLTKMILKKIHRFRKHGLGVLFLGTNGIGKTSLMAEIGKEAIVQGYKVKYLSAQSYVDSTKVRDSAELMAELLQNDFILLDELDKVYIKQNSDYVPKTLEVFLREALVNANVSVICATNLNEDTFTKTFGESTVSLMKRKMNFVSITGNDYSDILETQWFDLLQADYDFYHENIVTQAIRKQEIITEQELAEWE